MSEFINTYLNSLQYSQENDENRMKGGIPISEYWTATDTGIHDTTNNIIYGGDDGTIELHEEKTMGGFSFIPLGLVYFPPPVCEYDKNTNPKHVLSEDIPVISDKHFDSIFSLVSSQKKLISRNTFSSKKPKGSIPSTKTKKKQ